MVYSLPKSVRERETERKENREYLEWFFLILTHSSDSWRHCGKCYDFKFNICVKYSLLYLFIYFYHIFSTNFFFFMFVYETASFDMVRQFIN